MTLMPHPMTAAIQRVLFPRMASKVHMKFMEVHMNNREVKMGHVLGLMRAKACLKNMAGQGTRSFLT